MCVMRPSLLATLQRRVRPPLAIGILVAVLCLVAGKDAKPMLTPLDDPRPKSNKP